MTSKAQEPIFRFYVKFHDFLMAFSLFQLLDFYPQGDPLEVSPGPNANYMVYINNF